MENRFRSTLDKVMDELGPEAFVCWFDCDAGETNINPKIQDIKYAYQLGAKYYEPFNIKNLIFQLL